MTSEGEANVRELIDRGEVLLAYDHATALLAEHPDAPALRYLAALSLARAGARDRARAELDELDARGGVIPSDLRLAEDVAALRARLVKDEALGQSGRARRATGGDLHVVLPCRPHEFAASSVRPGGERWVARFHACLRAASTVRCEPSCARPDDPSMYAFGSRLAMGAAIIRAHTLTTQAVQLAIWDERASTGKAGTAADVECWRSAGRRTEVVRWNRPRVAPRHRPERST